jgi:hypothetical protein
MYQLACIELTNTRLIPKEGELRLRFLFLFLGDCVFPFPEVSSPFLRVTLLVTSCPFLPLCSSTLE